MSSSAPRAGKTQGPKQKSLTPLEVCVLDKNSARILKRSLTRLSQSIHEVPAPTGGS